MNKNTLLIIAIAFLAVVCIPVSANTHIASGGTIVAGDEHYNLDFVTDECTTFAMWGSASDIQSGFSPNKVIDLTNHNDVVFNLVEYRGYSGVWHCYSNPSASPNEIMYGPTFFLNVPTITPEPTPVPTPSEGNIIISSFPSAATVYVDNYIRGITPLTVTVANGEHVVRVRMDGYTESVSTVIVAGDEVSVLPELVPATTPPTTIATNIPTTTETTIPTTEPTTIPTTEPTIEITQELETTQPEIAPATIDYSETIAAIQTQLNEQATQIATQQEINQQQEEDIGLLQQIVNAIKAFLGLE